MLKQQNRQDTIFGITPWWQEKAQQQTAITPARAMVETADELTIPLCIPARTRLIERFATIVHFVAPIILTSAVITMSLDFHFRLPWEIYLGCLLYWLQATLHIVFHRWIEKKRKKQAIALSRTGIQLTLLFVTIGPIYWDEIKEIRPGNGGRSIDIVPRNTEDLARRLGGRAGRFLKVNEILNRPITQFGPSCVPYKILSSLLPMTPEEFIEKVATYHRRR